MTRTRLLAGAVALTTIALSACSDDSETLRVYSGRHYGIEVAFDQFEEDTGIKLEFLTGNDGELRERIAEEQDETQADVYITVDAGNLVQAAEDGLFQPSGSAVLDEAVPEELRDPDGYWYGLTLRARTIVYNPDRIAEADVPATYEELAEPQWDGRVCMRNSLNGYQQSLVASLIAEHGEDEARRIVGGWADNAEILANDILILESVADGLCEVGVANHYYLGRLLAEDPDFNVALKWANQDDRGVHVNISGAGVTTWTDQPELALRFLEWLATDGQNVLVDLNHEYPANPAITPEPLIASEFGTDFLRDDLDAASLGALNPDAVRLMDEVGYG